MADTLAALLRLRQQVVGTERRALADALAAQDVAEQHAAAAREAIAREIDLATEAADDGAVEAFARWLPRGRAALAIAEAAVADADIQVARVRATLAAARAALRAAETLAAARAAEMAARLARREQDDLDETAARH